MHGAAGKMQPGPSATVKIGDGTSQQLPVTESQQAVRQKWYSALACFIDEKTSDMREKRIQKCRIAVYTEMRLR